MDLELFKNISKYPFALDCAFHDTLELKQNKTCEKCKEKDCLSYFSGISINLSEYICSKQYNNVLLVIGNVKFILNGLIFDDNRIIKQGRKEARREWIIDKKSVLLFASKIKEIEKYLAQQKDKNTVDNFSMFHDFKTSMSIFYTCTQDIITKLPGNTFQEKLENSDVSIKDLYNALDLITSQLGMIDVIANPASITFGNKKEINIYKLFHKMTILFRHLSNKEKLEIELINVDDAYIRNSYCYESIEFIPLILLDNAIKYSTEFSTVRIEIIQQYNKAKIKVKNIGPFVKNENREKIFEKFFRDDYARKFSKDGIGMGLWIAQRILEAHGSKIYYNKDTSALGDIGLNIFEFDLATV